MSFNLLDSVKQLFTNEVISKAASALGENQSNISQAVSGVVPTILSSLVAKATSGDHGATNILQLAKDAAGSGMLGKLGSLFGSADNNNIISAGFDTVKSLFGDKFNNVVHAISNYSGIKDSSAVALLSGITPATLAVLGNHVNTNNTNAGGLASSLESHKSQILSALPTGLSSIASLTGLSAAVTSMSGKAKSAMSSAPSDGSRKGMKFLLPLLLALIVIGLLIWFFSRGCNSDSSAALTKDTTQTHVDTTMATGPVSIKVTLPDSTKLDAYKGGIEDQLVTFLMSDYAKLGEDSLKKIWFDFDNLTFKTGSAEITPESLHQINNIAAILKAFPKSNLKLGGYTDKTGDETVNKKLSTDRAQAVKAELDKMGMSSQVTGAEGYGSDYAKYPATAPESDRVHDRHISVSVRL
jgi:outer membrane protein OmpA-like peptidoglycan-associated protein